jgi:hypothetical protein
MPVDAATGRALKRQPVLIVLLCPVGGKLGAAKLD